MTSQDQSLTGPAPAAARIEALDALRGFAVLGIFVINIIGFSMPEIAFSNPTVAGGDGALNYGLWSFTTVFVEGSMRGLFSLMFGAGVILFTARALYPDGPIRIADLYYRRTLWLLVFGVFHALALLMPGDVLQIYGLAGLALFPFRILKPRKLIFLAGVFLAGLTLLTYLDEAPQTELGRKAAAIEAKTGELSDEDEAVLEEWRENLAYNDPPEEEIEDQIAARTGDISTVYASNAEVVAAYSGVSDILWWTADAFMMMLIGMAFYQWRIITGERSTMFYLFLAGAGYAIGLSLRILAVTQRWEADFSPILWAWATFEQTARVATTIGHIGMFFLLWKAFSRALPFRALAAAGRMALSNYIGQTIIANLIFSGVGLGLYGSLDRANVYLIMVVIWIAQLAFSLWWLARFRFGPLEWVWRCLTYWRAQPFRKTAAPADKGIAV
ncbi:DUF418 domain-containing protein [Hyphococcus sp.]|jgi:uncharacterized protein|uniref:DUF418 domain-containing protein n=1 Tax=Hyphococcus sp. TaxID=2038636 RepID=UPI003D0FE31D